MSLFGDSKDKPYPRATELLADHPVIGNNGTYTPSLTTMSSKGPCLRHRPARPAGGYRSYSERLLQPRSSREAMQGTTAFWKESAQRSERQAEGRRAKKGKKQGEVEVVKTGSCIDCQKGRRVNRRCQDSFAGTCASPNFDLTSSPRSPDSGSPRHFSSANPSTTAWSVLLSTHPASDCGLDLANLEKRAFVENLSALPSRPILSVTMSTPLFWSTPIRYLRWASHEKPAIFWSLVIGGMGPVALVGLPPLRRALGDVDPEPIPMSYPSKDALGSKSRLKSLRQHRIIDTDHLFPRAQFRRARGRLPKDSTTSKKTGHPTKDIERCLWIWLCGNWGHQAISHTQLGIAAPSSIRPR